MDKFTKLFKIGFSVECFTADLSRFCGTNCKTCLLSGPIGNRHQIQTFQRFPYFLRYQILSLLATSEVNCTFFSVDNNLVPCHSW